MEKRRMALTFVLVVAGLALVGYGLFRPSAPVAPSEDGQVEAAPTSELAVTKEVARGGVKRDESGQIKKTYEGKAPEACST